MKKNRQYYRPKVANTAEFDKIMHARESSGIDAVNLPAKGIKRMAFYVPNVETLQNKIADELFAWSKELDSQEIRQFFLDRGMSFNDFKSKTKENEYCKMLLQMTRDMIAAKLQRGWRSKAIEPSYAQFYARFYDQDYMDMALQLKAVAAAQANATTTVQVVEIPAIPNSYLVKERKTSEN